MTAWPPWRERGAPAGLLQYVVPDAVKGLFRDGLPGPSGVAALDRLREVYDAFVGQQIRYANEVPLADGALQVIRPPDQVLWQPRHANCLDLAVTFSGACMVAGLHPCIVVVAPEEGRAAPRHALVLVWLDGTWREGGADTYPLARGEPVWESFPEGVAGRLSESVTVTDDFVAVDPTDATRYRPDGSDPETFDASVAGAAAKLLGDEWRWGVGVDVGLSWRAAGSLAVPQVPERFPLRDPYLHPDESNAGPLELTRPEFGVVPFQERDQLLALLHWAEEPDPFAGTRIAVVHGAGGAGKTHLLAELAERLRQRGWVAGLLPTRGAGPGRLGSLVSPLLVGVDYADARLPDVVELFRVLRSRPVGPTCVVLTARGVSGWWDECKRRCGPRATPTRWRP